MYDLIQQAKDVTLNAILLTKKLISQPPTLSLDKNQPQKRAVANSCPNCMGLKFVYSQGSMHFCWMCIEKTIQ